MVFHVVKPATIIDDSSTEEKIHYKAWEV